MNNSKLRIGWFTFTCCEDSTIVFTELLNKHYEEWRKKIHFVHAKVLQTKNWWEPMDVAFVEGAITSPDQETKLKKIRSLATKLITIGACACIGMPSAQRNTFSPETKQEIEALLVKFRFAPSVKRVADVVIVDDSVDGCPMNEEKFISTLEKLFSEFSHA